VRSAVWRRRKRGEGGTIPGEPGLGQPALVLVGTFDQPLHGLGGHRRTAAQMEMEVEQDGPQRQQLGEHRRVSRWSLRRFQERGTHPFTHRLVTGDRLNARILLGGDLRADRFRPSRCHATTPCRARRLRTAHAWLPTVPVWEPYRAVSQIPNISRGSY
jgi:hypothetical protein